MREHYLVVYRFRYDGIRQPTRAYVMFVEEENRGGMRQWTRTEKTKKPRVSPFLKSNEPAIAFLFEEHMVPPPHQ